MRTAVVAVVLALAVPSAGAVAHEVIYKGTVVSADQKGIRVSVVDEKTKKPATLTFRYDKETKFLRGDKLMSFADAKIQKGEKIAITTDHDFEEFYAFVVRLDARK